jgi:hypothetical protein
MVVARLTLQALAVEQATEQLLELYERLRLQYRVLLRLFRLLNLPLVQPLSLIPMVPVRVFLQEP